MNLNFMELTIDIKDQKIEFIIELLRAFDFVDIIQTDNRLPTGKTMSELPKDEPSKLAIKGMVAADISINPEDFFGLLKGENKNQNIQRIEAWGKNRNL